MFDRAQTEVSGMRGFFRRRENPALVLTGSSLSQNCQHAFTDWHHAPSSLRFTRGVRHCFLQPVEVLPAHPEHFVRTQTGVLHDDEHVPQRLTSERKQLPLTFTVDQKGTPVFLVQPDFRSNTGKTPSVRFAQHPPKRTSGIVYVGNRSGKVKSRNLLFTDIAQPKGCDPSLRQQTPSIAVVGLGLWFKISRSHPREKSWCKFPQQWRAPG